MLVFWPWMGMRVAVCEGVSLARRLSQLYLWYVRMVYLWERAVCVWMVWNE